MYCSIFRSKIPGSYLKVFLLWYWLLLLVCDYWCLYFWLLAYFYVSSTAQSFCDHEKVFLVFCISPILLSVVSCCVAYRVRLAQMWHDPLFVFQLPPHNLVLCPLSLCVASLNLSIFPHRIIWHHFSVSLLVVKMIKNHWKSWLHWLINQKVGIYKLGIFKND